MDSLQSRVLTELEYLILNLSLGLVVTEAMGCKKKGTLIVTRATTLVPTLMVRYDFQSDYFELTADTGSLRAKVEDPDPDMPSGYIPRCSWNARKEDTHGAFDLFQERLVKFLRQQVATVEKRED